MSEHSFKTVESALPESGFKRGDTVKMYKQDTKFQYPCIHLDCEIELEEFRIRSLKSLLGNKSLISDQKHYYVYLRYKGTTMQIGVLPETKIKLLLTNKLFKAIEKRAFLNEGQVLEGDMLFALCTVTENI